MSPQARETKAKFGNMSSGKGNKSKNKQMRPHQIKKLLHSKGNYHENKKSTCWLGEDISNDTTDKELISKIYIELI